MDYTSRGVVLDELPPSQATGYQKLNPNRPKGRSIELSPACGGNKYAIRGNNILLRIPHLLQNLLKQ